MPATQKLYLTDSYLLETTARVLESKHAGDGFDIVLDRTVLFPTSGGQPSDRGWLGDEPVLDVRLEGDRVVHRTAGPVEETFVSCRVDAALRLDHMQQHSGQHLLSRVILDRLGAPTVSFHLGATTSTIDLMVESQSGTVVSRTVDDTTMADVEQIANEHVRSASPIRATTPTATEVAVAPPDLHALSGGELRIIDIHGLDRSFCCGTHMRTTAEIGPIKILDLERRGPLVRVEFVCGLRTLGHHERLHRVVKTLIRMSSARTEGLPAYLESVLNDREEKSRQLRGLQAALAKSRAEAMATKAPAAGAYRVARQIQDGGSADEVRLMAEALSDAYRCFFVGGHRPETGDKGVVVIAAPAGSGVHAGKLLGEVLAQVGGRGGGRPELAQGGAPRDQVQTAVDLAYSEVIKRVGGHGGS